MKMNAEKQQEKLNELNRAHARKKVVDFAWSLWDKKASDKGCKIKGRISE